MRQTILPLALILAAFAAQSATAPDGVTPEVSRSLMEKLDSSGLRFPISATLPGGEQTFRFETSFSPAAVTETFGGASFDLVDRLGDREVLSSNSLRYEYDPVRSALFLQVNEEARLTAVPIDRALLIADTRERLTSLGIPAAETPTIVQREVAADLRSERGFEGSETVAIKNFVEREINGIPVEGSRLVFTYDAEGRFAKLLGRWPRLASAGHRLQTVLRVGKIAELVAASLAGKLDAQELDRSIPLRFVYLTEFQPDGSVRLALAVEAAYVVARTGALKGLQPHADLVPLPR